MKSLFLNKSKKYIAGFLCPIFILNLFFLAPKKATATTMPVSVVADPGMVVLNMTAAEIGFQNAGLLTDQTIATADQMVQNKWQTIVKFVSDKLYQVQNLIFSKAGNVKEYILDPLFWTMANVVIDQFGDAIVDWIRNGFDGSPMFLSDPEGFFRDTANQASGAIINDLNMNWLCDSLKFRFDLDFFLPGTSRSKYACTYEDIVENFSSLADRDLGDWIDVNVSVNQQNVVRRFGDDFRNGGFLMWLNTSLPRNNTTGRILTAWDEVAMASEQAKEKERFGLSINGGFFGLRKCVEYGPGDVYEPFGKTDDPANTNPKDKCTKYVDTTPGQLVQDQLKNVGGKDFSRLQVADEIDEIIGALATEMIGWLLTGGNDDEGVLGYNRNARKETDGYDSGSNRDHYGALSKSKELTNKKTEISNQIVIIKNGEEQYNTSLKNYNDIFGGENDREIVLAKLKCIRATSTNDSDNVYDDSDCSDASEETKNVTLSSALITEINDDIDKIESEENQNDSGKYGENENSARTLELFNEFESNVMSALSLDEIEDIENEYCYSYDKTDETGEICGLYTDEKGESKKETHETHSEEEATAINEEAMNEVPKNKITESEYLCILNKYTQTEELIKGECISFNKSSSKPPSPY